MTKEVLSEEVYLDAEVERVLPGDDLWAEVLGDHVGELGGVPLHQGGHVDVVGGHVGRDVGVGLPRTEDNHTQGTTLPPALIELTGIRSIVFLNS